MIVFGVDAAKTSGWAIIDPTERRIIDSGLAVHPFERANAVRALVDAGGPDLVAFELHLFGPKKTVASLNRSSGRWLEVLEIETGVREPKVIFSAPSTWRRELGAPSRWAGTTQPQRRAAAKLWAISYAQTVFGARDNISDDEAEAICIAAAASLTPCEDSATVPEWQSVLRVSGSPKSGSKKSRGGSKSSSRSGTTSSRPKKSRRPRRKSTSGTKSTSKTS